MQIAMTNLADINKLLSGESLDSDPTETREWIDAFETLVAAAGKDRARYVLQRLSEHAAAQGVSTRTRFNTPYCNTIDPRDQPPFPGDFTIEQRLSSIIRWNALAMVVRANSAHPELGGHIASFASAADLFEVGFNHFFHGHDSPGGADCIYFQPHSAPGVYSRAFLESRLTETQLDNYRRETLGKGLSSYPHPWLMPGFWQFPTGSMGLGPMNAIYQARFMRYLEHRGIQETEGRKVWAFPGDGEMDEPESLAALSLAAREGLDNLIFVVNCNLQRLDGPVRGNGSIVQELEGLFAGAGWNVIKLMWGSDWDPLFARDREGIILRRLHETVDGEFQTYAATDGRFNREHFFSKYPELRALVADITDDDIDRLKRGGHDPIKIYSAYHAAVIHKGQPTVILAQTKKGYGMGLWGQGKMTTHTQKKLDDEALIAFRDRFSLPLTNEQVTGLKFYRPADNSPEMRYLHARRAQLGGYMPLRPARPAKLAVPALASFGRALDGSNGREQSTTMVFVQLLAQLLKDPTLGKRVVPIVADEARTFGMQSLFRQIAIYSPFGQLYDPEDKEELLYYKEAKDGQILEEGITEAGALSSWIAAATSYSAHGMPMLPFYIFYSIFGFQRVGDLIWAAADSRSRGFLLGATAGRTTLSGEGLQHEDGTSHLIAATIPTCRAYDPTFGYELAVIVQDGARRLLEGEEDIFYYVTVMNENYVHPSMPEGVTDGVLRGMYLLRKSALASGTGSKANATPRVRLFGSGTILRESLAAAEILESEYGVAADVWSVTSYTELRREGMSIERWNRLHPSSEPRRAHVERSLADDDAPIIAATDYLSALPDLIRPYVSARFVSLGTDGFGRSDTRANLRRFFEMDRAHIVVAALKSLSDEGKLAAAQVEKAIENFALQPDVAPPWER